MFERCRSRNYNVGYGRPSYNRRPLPRTSVYTRNAYSNGYRRSSSYNGFGLGLGQLAGVVLLDYSPRGFRFEIRQGPDCWSGTASAISPAPLGTAGRDTATITFTRIGADYMNH